MRIDAIEMMAMVTPGMAVPMFEKIAFASLPIDQKDAALHANPQTNIEHCDRNDE